MKFWGKSSEQQAAEAAVKVAEAKARDQRWKDEADARKKLEAEQIASQKRACGRCDFYHLYGENEVSPGRSRHMCRIRHQETYINGPSYLTYWCGEFKERDGT